MPTKADCWVGSRAGLQQTSLINFNVGYITQGLQSGVSVTIDFTLNNEAAIILLIKNAVANDINAKMGSHLTAADVYFV